MPCSRCHRKVSGPLLGGNCPACLLQGALEDEPESEATGTAPERLDEYEILSEVGRGGASVVYRARHVRLNRIVALKVLHAGSSVAGDAFERFRVEAQAVARLEHPNIVPLYETGRDSGTPFLTLRYFPRGSLAQRLAAQRSTPVEAARWMATAARAIHYAHQRGVLHRDLKPSNLLLDENGEVHIADFGLAKVMDESTSLTLSTSVLGTPNYMAPEQAAGRAKDASVAADIYSLGAVLFELLTGRPPFIGATPLIVLRQVADEDPPRPQTLNPALDRDLEAICLRCLEKEPERRYPTAAALADDLEAWRRGEPISVRPTTAVERSLKWIRRRPLVAALGSLAILALTVGLAGTTWQWSIARKTAEAARLDAYLSDMDLVQRLHESQPDRAYEILQRHRPKNGERDLRDWEWRYFWQLCRADEPERTWHGSKALFSSAISDDGKFMAIGEFNGGAKIFDPNSLEPVHAGAEDVNPDIAPWVPSGNRMAAVVAFIPGTRLFAWSETRSYSNCVVQFWDADQRRIVRTFPQCYIVRNMVATPDGRRLIVSYQSPDGRTVVWDLASERAIAEVPKGPATSNFSAANVLAVSPDGKWMTYDECPGQVRVVEVETGRDVWRFPLEDQYCLACEFSPDGKTLAVCGGFSKGTSPQLWDLETGQNRGGVEAVAGWMSRLRFSRDGRRLYASGSGPVLSVWDLETRRLQSQLRLGMPDVCDFVLAPDERTLFTVSQERLARWDLRKPLTRSARRTLPIAPGWQFMPDSKAILGVTTNGTVALFGGSDWTEIQEFAQGATNATRVGLLPDGSGYVVGDLQGTLSARRWDDHAVTQVIGQMSGGVSYLALDSTTGNAVAADAQSFVAWDLATGQRLADLPHFQVQGSSDLRPEKGRWSFLGYEGVAAHIDLATGQIRRQQLPYAEAEGFSYSPSGEYAVTTGARMPVRLYRAQDWQFVRQLDEARTGFYACLSPNGRRIATANSDAEAIRLWDFVTGQRICSLSADIDLAMETRFSPDGNVIAQSGSLLKAVSVWWAPSWEEIARREAAGSRDGR